MTWIRGELIAKATPWYMVQASGGTSFFGFWTWIVFDSHVKKMHFNVLHENIHTISY